MITWVCRRIKCGRPVLSFWREWLPAWEKARVVFAQPEALLLYEKEREVCRSSAGRQKAGSIKEYLCIGGRRKLLGKIAKFLFASALAGVGFKIKFSEVFSKGVKPIALGGITWLSVAASSMIFIYLFAGYVG